VAADVLLRFQLLEGSEELLHELGAEQAGMADGAPVRPAPAASRGPVPVPAPAGFVPLSALQGGGRR
jgi:hypothetical protein